MRCKNCGETNPLILEPLDNGGIYCPGCDHVTPQAEANEPRLIDHPAPQRRDLQ